MWDERRVSRLILASSVFLLCLVAVPLLVLSFYSFPSADDYSFGYEVNRAVQSGGGPLSVLAAAFSTVGTYWSDWQGSYSAVFLMALGPGAFSSHSYFLTTLVIMALFVGGTFFLLHVFLVELCGLSRMAWATTSSLLSAVTLLLLPSPYEALYWWNGAMYYTGYEGMMLFFVALLLRIGWSGSSSRSRTAALISIPLAAVLVGGNYISMMLTLEATIGLLLLSAAHGHKNAWRYVPILLVAIAGSAISALAPGNAVRSGYLGGMDALSTIYSSTVSTFCDLVDWRMGVVAILVCVLFPVFAREFRLAHFIWRAPALVTIVSLAYLATSYCPTYYALGDTGPERALDLRFELCALLVIVNAIWWMGWFSSQNVQPAPSTPNSPGGMARPSNIASLFFGAMLGMVIISLSLSTDAAPNLSSVLAGKSLISGEAQQYHSECLERERLLSASPDQDVVLSPLSVQPSALLSEDLSSDPGYWTNVTLAKWYGIRSVATGQDLM